MYRKRTAFSQGAKGLEQICLSVARDIVINVITANSIKALIRKCELRRVAALKGRIFHTFRFGVVLTQRLVE